MSHEETERKWMIDYLTPAVGCTIIEVGVGKDDGCSGAFPYLKLRKPGTKTAAAQEFKLEVSQDEEGNGPGFLFGLPSPGSSVTTIKLKSGLIVLAHEDGMPKRFTKADAEEELKKVEGMGHKAMIHKLGESRYVGILDDTPEQPSVEEAVNRCRYCGEIPEDYECGRGKEDS